MITNKIAEIATLNCQKSRKIRGILEIRWWRNRFGQGWRRAPERLDGLGRPSYKRRNGQGARQATPSQRATGSPPLRAMGRPS